MPGNNPFAGLEALTANRTYYVRTDGNDTNSGLSDTPSSAFKTITFALDVAAKLETSIYVVYIMIADGAYESFIYPNKVRNLTLIGNVANPQNVTVGKLLITQTDCEISGIKFLTGLEIRQYSTGYVHDCIFNYLAARNWANVYADTCSVYEGPNNFAAFSVDQSSLLEVYGMTLLGNRSYSRALAVAATNGILLFGNAPSGVCTGLRYKAELNGIINTYGGGANFLPGTVAGTTATGGQYV